MHAVELSAYCLSKYETTQAQWLRLASHNPSNAQPPGGFAPTLLHPVEPVSWQDCTTALLRAALALPSEAQWEFAARAGTDTPWWTGSQRESLRELRAANLADQAAARAGGVWSEIADWPELDDGSPLHAPVGSYAANGFGLHDVAGNLAELCQDGYATGFYALSPSVEPVAPLAGAVYRVTRGGAFFAGAAAARSASRDYSTPTDVRGSIGVRPARPVAN